MSPSSAAAGIKVIESQNQGVALGDGSAAAPLFFERWCVLRWRAKGKRFWLACLAAVLALAVAAGVALAADGDAPARRLIGDEPAKDNCWTGDIDAEKQTEKFLLPGVAVLKTPANPVAGIIVATGGVLAQLANNEQLNWQNWPHGRYQFWHAPPDKMLGFLPQVATVTLAMLDFLANSIFSLTKMLVCAGINVIVLAFTSEWSVQLSDYIGKAVGDLFPFFGGGVSGNSFAGVAFSLAVAGLLVVLVARLLRGRVASSAAALAVAAAATAACFLYVANAAPFVRAVGSFTDDLAGLALTASAKFTFTGERTPPGVTDPLAVGLANAGQAAWHAMVAAPWAAAMFGTADPEKLRVTESEWQVLDKKSFPKEKLAQMEAKLREGRLYADTLFLGCGDDASRNAVADALGSPSKSYWFGLKTVEVDHGEHPGSAVCMGPDYPAAGRHLFTASMSLLPALAFVGLAIGVGGGIIVAQLLLVALLTFLPLALIAALVPDAGWSFATRYLQATLGSFAVKVFYGLYLGIVLSLANAIVYGFLG